MSSLVVNYEGPINLSPFLLPSFLAWREKLRLEHTQLYKRLAEQNTQVKKVNEELGDASFQKKSLVSLLERKKGLLPQLEKTKFDYDVCDKHWKWMETTINEALTECAKASCMKFVSDVVKRLPQELVDLVYGFLLDDELVAKLTIEVRQQFESHRWYTGFKTPHYFDHSFVPTPFAVGLVDIAAKKNAGSYRARSQAKIHWYESIAEFTEGTFKGLDYPISNFFMDVHVEIFVPAVLAARRSETEDCETGIQDEEFRRRLTEPLLAIPAHKDRYLTIDIYMGEKETSWNEGLEPAEFEPVTSLLDGALETLKGKGFKDVYPRFVFEKPRGAWWKTRTVENPICGHIDGTKFQGQ
ncbi:hypothetical protein BCR34DRAFT_589897 [Clohesyomyces aquaticus]|uniref:Uncharacterized protein n=1 Tax=Clohesyomyces aquaticus TaxID=1231657 RepID=A0A1Y1ZEB7_9PLEO|nr:hypothetical protein BCR34DRAFT_589897 [Clohesyomyces aquaticus]